MESGGGMQIICRRGHSLTDAADLSFRRCSSVAFPGHFPDIRVWESLWMMHPGALSGFSFVDIGINRMSMILSFFRLFSSFFS
ncbi:MAG: hypothetical protein RLZZ436_3585 [Planctomycetota bacterium]